MDAERPTRRLRKLSRWEERVAWTRVASSGSILDVEYFLREG